MLRRLAYVSTPALRLLGGEVTQILEVSRTRNAAAGVTGVLVYTGTDFAQLIEGESGAVDRLWRTLHRDARHTDLSVFLDEPAERAWFASWPMGYLYDEGLTAQIAHWRFQPPQHGDMEIEALRLLLASAEDS